MLPPSYLMSVGDDFVELYGSLEQEIIADVARRIVKTGYVTSTAGWQLEKAKQLGLLQKDIEKSLSRTTGMSRREVKKLLKEAGIKAVDRDDVIHLKAGKTVVPFGQSETLKAILLQGTDDTLSVMANFTKTTAKTASAALANSLDKAYMQTMSGAFSSNQAIRNTIKDLSAKGLDRVAYPSGTTRSIESVVRSCITTGVNQTAAKLQLARADELGCDLVEVTAHSGARPTHAVWQGEIYSRKGKGKYPDFYDETGYGQVDGLCGVNCYHNFYPYYEGVSTRTFDKGFDEGNGKTNDEVYEEAQKQRYHERQVRASRKECYAIKAAIDATDDENLKRDLKADFTQASVKLKRREAKLKAFCKETDRTYRPDRVVTGQWNRSVSSSASWANKKARNK